MFNYKVLEDWLKVDHTVFNKYLDIIKPDDYVPVESKECVKSRSLLSLMNFGAEEFSVSFDKCATNIIQRLFETYCDEETLILVSRYEHENVIKILKNYKNVVYLDTQRDIRYTLMDIKSAKNVFVYVIGTQISTGITTPDSVFAKIRAHFKQWNIPVTIVMDDVQGMFLTPRDYSVADYVVGTAHAILHKYNLGILLYKKGLKNLGFDWDEEGFEYYQVLKPILDAYKTKFYQFGMVMDTVFDYPEHDYTSVPYVYTFEPRDCYKFRIPISPSYEAKLLPEVHTEGLYRDAPYSFFRFRAQEALEFGDEFVEKLKKIEHMIDIRNGLK